MANEYICALSEKCLDQAKKELNEIPSDRLSSVEKLREWIRHQPHLICRTDTIFLLKFLRTAKFSQLRAREMIEGYLRIKVERPEWYTKWNPTENHVARLFKSGMYNLLPGYYKDGIKVMIYRYAKLSTVFPKIPNLSYEEKHSINKAFIMSIAHCLRDENAQVSGVLYILDFDKFPIRGLSLYSMAETKSFMAFQNRCPGRFKGFWAVNEGPFIDAFLALFLPFAKPKLKRRIRYFGDNLEGIIKDIPNSMLPLEWLPDEYTGPNAGTLNQLSETFWEGISSDDSVKGLLEEGDPKWGIDMTKKSKDVPVSSFRKMNID